MSTTPPDRFDGAGRSPFSQVRYDYEEQHVYFLPRALRKLESRSPTFLVGSRGSGKTTLLRAMWWRERLHNAHLREQLGDDPSQAGT